MMDLIIRVFRLRCGNCTFVASGLHEDTVRATMLEHLVCVHSGQHL